MHIDIWQDNLFKNDHWEDRKGDERVTIEQIIGK
jgi:hypothetical protein